MTDQLKIDETIVTTVVLSLEALVAYMQTRLPGVSFVYDDNLGYETGMTEMRGQNNLRDEFTNKLPSFFFKRSVLRAASEGQGRRSVTNSAVAPVPNTQNSAARLYGAFYGTYDVEFNFVSVRMSEMENFEVSWLSESGIPQNKQIDISVPNLGDFSYFVTYNPLDDKIISSSGNYYKVLTGTMSVRGWYLSFQGDASLVKQINSTFQTFSGQVIGTDIAQGGTVGISGTGGGNTDTVIPTN